MSVFTKLSKSLASFLQTLQQKHPQKVGFSFELYFIENIKFGQSQMRFTDEIFKALSGSFI